MNDRFKFRAGFTISFYDIAGNDVERQIILDSCFSIDNGGEGICVNEKIIQEALDIYVAKDEHKSAWDFINANYAETDGYYFIDSVDFLDQCTGLKDKNGKLIYEGDIVHSSLDGGTQKVIYWDDGLASFMAYNRYPDKLYTQRIGDGYFIELGFEVIGNIHENWDLVEEEMLRPITQDIGKVCAFYADNPSQVTYDTLTGIEDDGKSKKYTGESGLISCNCRRLNETENRLRSEWRKNG